MTIETLEKVETADRNNSTNYVKKFDKIVVARVGLLLRHPSLVTWLQD